jgi:hypothetical protein
LLFKTELCCVTANTEYVISWAITVSWANATMLREAFRNSLRKPIHPQIRYSYFA